jgi:hypothetical protein
MANVCFAARNLGVNYSSDCTQATVSWWEPTTGSNFKYNVYRDDKKIASAITETSFVDVDFNPAHNQKWSVAVVCDSGESEWISLTRPACGVGIDEKECKGVNVYSNKNIVHIKNVDTLRASAQQIEIHDITGKLVYQTTLTDSETIITLNVAEGIYHVKLVSQDGKMVVKKISITQ